MMRDKINRFLVIYLPVVMIILGIGYASLSNDLTAAGIVTIKYQDEIAIVSIIPDTYISNYNKTIFTTNLELDNSDDTKTIEMKLKNLGNSKQIFDGIVYDKNHSDLYSNLNIIPNVTGIIPGNILNPKGNDNDEAVVNVTFSYDDVNNLTDNSLEGTVNLHFTALRKITYLNCTNSDGLKYEYVRSKPFTDINNVTHYDSVILANPPHDIVITDFSDTKLVLGTDYTYDNSSGIITFEKSINSDIIISPIYNITYVLNGGTQALNQPTTISSNELIELLEPTKDEYHFLGWYDNENFTGNKITELANVSSNIVLYANWSKYDFYLSNATVGTSDSVVNTGIKLFSTENVNRNFRIAFTVDSYNEKYDNPMNVPTKNGPTIVSSMDEKGKPWPGFVFRLASNSARDKSYYSIKINDSHIESVIENYSLEPGIDVEIIRENSELYIKIGSSMYTKILSYDETIDTFDVPVTIGGNIASNGKYDRFFEGSLSNIIIEFYEGSIITNALNEYVETRTDKSYSLTGTILFNGTNYIDTGLNLFSENNIDKDFDITFILESINTNSFQATLVNAKDESNPLYPGFAYRTDSSNNMNITARWPGEENVNYIDSANSPKKVKISRRDGIIYYSIAGSQEKVLISTPSDLLNETFNSNLTFGASINDEGNPFRYFKGIVSNINVNIYDD